MKRFLALFMVLVVIFTFAACGEENKEDDTYTVDYNDAESFESALNNGTKVKGKIVQFYVEEYAPNSILGINCHAGEHLNFLFEDELDVEAGDTIVVKITEEPSKVFLIGSWKVPCEFLGLGEANEEEESNTSNETTTDSTESTTENKETESQKITVTMSEDELKKMPTAEAEAKLREMGFTNFEYETLSAGDRSDLDGKIGAVEIKSWLFGNGDFSKGDTYDSDATVVLWSYKYTEPEKPSPVFYSTNDYETAKKGNTGVFSYKNKSGSYDVYWIIDFDEGYVYFFTDGNGEETCDKVKIAAGDLNDRITATWHDGGDQWSWYLHFKYKNHPETLIVNDHNGFATEFTTTDLDDALSVRRTKRIKEY